MSGFEVLQPKNTNFAENIKEIDKSRAGREDETSRRQRAIFARPKCPSEKKNKEATKWANFVFTCNIYDP